MGFRGSKILKLQVMHFLKFLARVKIRNLNNYKFHSF